MWAIEPTRERYGRRRAGKRVQMARLLVGAETTRALEGPRRKPCSERGKQE
ncbi:MAG: hypothetical protein KatS3mg008_1414 [Acidimicrobiales bacterium]|nr:MAG: hypothetical protein KatS3mg008_1414 [Acidimicrobiales bacterium]